MTIEPLPSVVISKSIPKHFQLSTSINIKLPQIENLSPEAKEETCYVYFLIPSPTARDSLLSNLWRYWVCTSFFLWAESPYPSEEGLCLRIFSLLLAWLCCVQTQQKLLRISFTPEFLANNIIFGSILVNSIFSINFSAHQERWKKTYSLQRLANNFCSLTMQGQLPKWTHAAHPFAEGPRW